MYYDETFFSIAGSHGMTPQQKKAAAENRLFHFYFTDESSVEMLVQ